MTRPLLLAFLLLLAGCAERWAKPGADDAEFRAMQAHCDAYAHDRWPPLLRQEMLFPGHFVPPVRSCDNRGRCTWFGGWYEPPQMTVIDDNLRPRNQERRACYLANGWTPVED
ncbi:MAG: hypothetical protein IT555_03465 [Acetobacteraceae bacterium]|nr:hypothetical protein [Acetobacteraceae bacterium]